MSRYQTAAWLRRLLRCEVRPLGVSGNIFGRQFAASQKLQSYQTQFERCKIKLKPTQLCCDSVK